MANGIIALNSGSTSIKFTAFRGDRADSLDLICHGEVDGIGSMPRFSAKNANSEVIDTHAWDEARSLDREEALRFVITWLESHEKDLEVVGVGHRVVQGGPYDKPVLVDGAVLQELQKLEVIVPSHQPFELEGIRSVAKTHPRLRQVAVFDTSFHRTMPAVAQRYALPKAVLGDHIRHWGYHGISYDYISRVLPRHAPNARRVIAAHLGGGASMCAMLNGRSMDTSMGFSALDGLPMATRSGAIDPHVLLFLLKEKKYSLTELENILYNKSGLLGISGISADMRALKGSTSPDAAAAIEYLVYNIVKFTGAFMAALGGLDAFVFTAGIGEHDASLRAAVVEKLAWLGIKLDDPANARNGPRISTEDSKVSVWAIPTNEELMIAQHTADIVAGALPYTGKPI
jgi:acetate kinase